MKGSNFWRVAFHNKMSSDFFKKVPFFEIFFSLIFVIFTHQNLFKVIFFYGCHFYIKMPFLKRYHFIRRNFPFRTVVSSEKSFKDTFFFLWGLFWEYFYIKTDPFVSRALLYFDFNSRKFPKIFYFRKCLFGNIFFPFFGTSWPVYCFCFRKSKQK